MAIRFLDPKSLDDVRAYVNRDPEFRLASKFVIADILLGVGDSECIVKIREGTVSEIQLNPTFMDAWSFYIRSTEDAWNKFLLPIPPPKHNGLFSAMISQVFKVGGNLEMAFSYFWVVCRMLDLFREVQNN